MSSPPLPAGCHPACCMADRDAHLVGSPATTISACSRRSERSSPLTHRWREPDSNHRFRLRYSPSGSSLVVSADLSTLPSRKRSSQRTQPWREQDSNHRFRGGRARRFVCRFSFAPDFSVGGQPTRGDIESLAVSRGTDGSNPVPCSSESATKLASCIAAVPRTGELIRVSRSLTSAHLLQPLRDLLAALCQGADDHGQQPHKRQSHGNVWLDRNTSPTAAALRQSHSLTD